MSVAPSSSQTSVASESKSLRSMFSNIHNKGFVPPKAPLASPKNPAIRKRKRSFHNERGSYW